MMKKQHYERFIICNIDLIIIRLMQCNPITGLDRPRGFQEVKVPRFRDNGTGWW